MTTDQEQQLKEIQQHLDNVKQNKEKLDQGLADGNDAIKSGKWFYERGGRFRPYTDDSFQDEVNTPYKSLLDELDMSINLLQTFLNNNHDVADDEKVKSLQGEVDQRVRDVVGVSETPGLKDQVKALAQNGSNRDGESNQLNAYQLLPQSISDRQPPGENTERPSMSRPPEDQRNVSRTNVLPYQITRFNNMDDVTVRRFDREFRKVADEAARNNSATGQNVSAEAKKITRGLELAASGAYYDGYHDYAAHNFGRDLVFGKGDKPGILSLVQDVQKRSMPLEQAVAYLNDNYHGKDNSVARNAFNYLSAREMARENPSNPQKPNGLASAQLAQDLLSRQGLIVAGDEPGTSKFVQVETTPLSVREGSPLNKLQGIEATRRHFHVTMPPADGGMRL